MRRNARALSAGSTMGRGDSLGSVHRAFAARGASSGVDGSGAPSKGPARLFLLTLAIAALSVTALAPAAGAAPKFVDSSFGAAAAGTLGGEFNQPRDIAVSQFAGHVGEIYVVDDNNHRIQRFAPNHTFQRAWGADVDSTVAGANFEICTVAANCKAGVASGGNAGDNLRNGAMDNPQGISIDQDTGEVYVTDRDNRRINVYTADGVFLRSFGQDVNGTLAGTGYEICPAADRCKAGVAGTAAGQFGSGNANLSLDVSKPDGNPASGFVFAADPGNRRVQQFNLDGTFVRAWGWGVDTGASEFEICTVASACQAAASGPSGSVHESAPGHFFGSRPTEIAVDAAGIVYASDGSSPTGSNRPQRFDSNQATAATLLLSPIGTTVLGSGPLALSTQSFFFEMDTATGRLLVHRAGGGGAVTQIQEVDTSTLAVTDSYMQDDSNPSVSGIGVDGPSSKVFVSTSSLGHRVVVLDADGGPAPILTLLPPSAVTSNSATLSGEVTPAPAGPTGLPTSYRFEYSTDALAWTPVAPFATVPGGGDDASAHPVSSSLTGLKPNTSYHVRLVATRPLAGATISSSLTLVTEAVPPTVETHPPTYRTDTTAGISGEIDPNGSATSYQFEYGIDTTYGSLVPAIPAPAGAGTGSLQVTENLDGLDPATAYHYRLCATNVKGTVCGVDRTLTTRATPPAPPERAYELVSPADKISGVGVGAFFPGDAANPLGLPSLDGERLIALGNAGAMLLDSAQAYANDYAFAERTAAGWLSHSPFTHPNPGAALLRFAQLNAASDDLSTVLWGSNGGNFRVFPEQESLEGFVAIPMLSDWESRWEVFGPLTHAQANDNQVFSEVVSGDGSTAVTTSTARGLAGPDDPVLDLPTTGSSNDPRATYVDDVSAGLSDTYPGEGIIEAAGVCDAGTLIPLVDENGTPAGPPGVFGVMANYGVGDTTITLASGTTAAVKAGHTISNGPGIIGATVVSVDSATTFTVSPASTGSGSPAFVTGGQKTSALSDDLLTAGACPPPVEYAPGEFRSGALVDRRGVQIPDDAPNAVSTDGSRIFFASPTGSGNAPPCSWGGGTTACPGQLYMRFESAVGDVATRWISRPAFTGQHPRLLGPAIFEGATPDGDKVYFRTSSPLTEDDPNGTGAVVPGGVKAGTASTSSWDLYLYDFTDSESDDPGAGSLTRVSAGPTGEADSNISRSTGGDAALRWLSADGERGYFVTSAPLPTVPGPTNGTTTVPGGTVATTNAKNLYFFDNAQPPAQRWRFVVRLPAGSDGESCSSTATEVSALFSTAADSPATGEIALGGPGRCVSGTADARLLTFFARESLVASDADDRSGDIYAYDAVADELSRVTAPQGGDGDAYTCAQQPVVICYGDPGIGILARPRLGLATDPADPSDRIVYFQSKSRLVADDTDSAYDVYEWRNGELSMISTGTGGPAYYVGNSSDGQDVFVGTRDDLSWQDVDAVMDVYDAREGGGIPQPLIPPACDVLADACQSAPVAAPPATGPSSAVLSGEGNFVEPPPRRCGKGKVRKGKRCVKKRKSKAGKRANNNRRASK